MAVKINITLETHEDYNLVVEAVKFLRSAIIVDAQAEGIMPAENAELAHKVRQLSALSDKLMGR